MSKSCEIVLNWVNNEIKIRPKIYDIQKSFSNGYHFGEIFFILKLISPEEFSQFVNTDNRSDKKTNFSKIEKICKDLFNLIIPEEDINNIMNKHYSKAVVLLYKIRNCIYKNNIHFNDIQIFGNAFSNDEIQTQIKEIIKRQFSDEEEENNERDRKSKRNNISNISMSNYYNEYEDESKDIISNDLNRNEINNKKYNFIYNIDNDIKEEIEENEEMDKVKYNNDIIDKNKDNNINIYKLKEKKILPSIKIKNFEQNIYDKRILNKLHNIKNKILLKPKNISVPINKKLSRNNKNNSCENFFINQNRKSIIKNDNNIDLGKSKNSNRSQIFNAPDIGNNFINSQLIDVSYFNKKLEGLGVISDEYKLNEDNTSIEKGKYSINNFYKNIKNNLNNEKNKNEILYESIYNNKTIDEVKNELKSKIKYKRIENKIKQKELRRQLSQKNFDESKIQLNFMNINKNNFNKKNKSMSLLFKNYSNEASIRRLKYSKDLAEKKEKEDYARKTFFISNKIKNNQKKLMPMILSNRNLKMTGYYPEKKEYNFNHKKFFEELDKLDYHTNIIKCERRHKIKIRNTNIIKDIVLFIIDMAMEGYIYQIQFKKELMDLDTYLKFNIYFLKNKILREKIIIIEDNEHKKSSTFDENINIDKLISKLTNEEKYLIQDYINYLGIWSEDKIYDNALRGLKLEYRYINNDNNNSVNSINNSYFGINDYEPTTLEIEDLTLPKYNIGNYIFGDTILEVLEQKMNNYTDIGEILYNDLNKETKWDYIPYKIALVGYPLCGKKTVSEKINNKYPNIKIYSIYKLIRDYYEVFLKLSDPPEKPNKNSKKNEKTNHKGKDKENIFEKQERQKKLKEFQPIINLIQPYIDFQQNNNNTSSKNNISKVESNNNLNEDINNNNITNNNSNNEKFIMPDENLCKLLIKKIEEDFPFQTQEQINKDNIELQKKIYELENQIEVIKKRKEEEKKPNPKDDLNIEKLENEIKELKEKSITGFILSDYPTNINQCYLLENYLTGFIDEKRKPKSEENNIIEKISSIIDFKLKPKEKRINKKSGLNFLVHISTKEHIINERFKSIKYDPVEDKIYAKSNFISDNKISERLVDEIPYFPKELFEYYKDEYNNNINKIINLYNQFGFIINYKKEESNNDNTTNNYENEEVIKTFQSIESDDLKRMSILVLKNKKNLKSKKNMKKSIKDKNKNKNNLAFNPSANTSKNKAYNFICANIIEKLYLEKEKYDRELFYNAYPEYKDKDKNLNNCEPDLNINEIKTRYKNKSQNKQDIKIIDYDSTKINNLIIDLGSINIKYNKYLGKFIHLFLKQKNDIYSRLNLVQTKFRNYINKKSDKKKIITNYVRKYNHTYYINPDLLSNEKVIKELISDIEDLRTEVLNIVNKKQSLAIKEHKEMKNSGFIEVELVKFYYNIKDLILLETEKFLTVLNNMIILYTRRREKDKDKEKDNKFIIDLVDELKKNIINKTESIQYNTKEFNYYFNERKDIKFSISLDEIIENIFYNLEIIFKNCIKLLFSYNKYLKNILKRIKEIIYNSLSNKKTLKYKKRRKNSEKKLYSISMLNDLLTNKDMGYILEENVKKMFFEEKNKYKFRICYIKTFAIKYIQIMKGTFEKVFDNMDDWIIKNVTLQSESLGFLIKILKQFLNDKKPIEQQNDIDYIELDEFEKVIEDEEINNNINNKTFNNSSNISNYNLNGSNHEIKLKPFDNSSVMNKNRIYDKIKLEYLINDNFLDTIIEEYFDEKAINKSKQKPKVKIIPPCPPSPTFKVPSPNIENNFGNNSLNNGDLNSSRGIIKSKNILNDTDFYFDVEKFKFIYKLIKKYEIEDGYISQQIFFQIFIKQFIFAKKKNIQQNANKDDEENDIIQNDIFEFEKNINININGFYNEEINIENKNNDINYSNSIYPAISKALKELKSKQIQRILDIFIINIKPINYIKIEKETEIDIENNKDSEFIEDKDNNKDNKRKNNIKKKTRKFEKSNNGTINEAINIDKNKKEEQKNNINNSIKEINESLKTINNNDIHKKEKEKEVENNNNVEYEVFLNTKEIFTILSLIGVNILTSEVEEKIENELKSKYIMDKYLSKKDFMEYKFWFEPFFDYINEKSENKDINNSQNIKGFLFDIWKNDDNSFYFNFKKFLEVLKTNKYVTNYVDFNDVRYYDILFEQ